ncbi:hypothetical protein EDC01DRAFT_643999 [Geopyxis carbonaria]|nr:hypothetical protein EDC01DRAFT_643999 [Geopyxis carbonaria]
MSPHRAESDSEGSFDSDEYDSEPDFATLGAGEDDDDDSDYFEEGASAEPVATPDPFADEDDDEDEADVEAEAGAVNDTEMESFHHALKAASGFKKGFKTRKSGGRRAVGEENYSFEVKSLMGEANTAFVTGALDKAMVVVKKVIQIEAGVYSAWKILGEIFKEKGEDHKCLLAWLTAAHAKPKDWELWLTCAKMSLDQFGADKKNYRDQAIYCYNRAIRANPDNIDAIYDRSLLLRETGQLRKAAEGFVLLNRLLPNDMTILREIAGLYMEVGKVREAITYYIKSVEHFKATGNPDGAFSWSELNIMVELYMMEKMWEDAIKTLKNLARWLYTRAEETFWEKLDDDREWDSDDKRKGAVRAYVPHRFPPETYILPLELRVKLGICRLKLDNRKEAMLHFKYLEGVEPMDYNDLFQEVGDALYNINAYEDAIHYYFAVLECTQYVDRKVWFNLATCYKALDQVDDAEDCYATVLEGYPRDTEAMMQLASIYEVSDRKAEALELVNDVIRIRRDAEKAAVMAAAGEPFDSLDADDENADKQDQMAFLPNAAVPKRAKRKRRAVMTAQQLLEMNERRTEQTAVKFRKLEYLKEAMLAGEKTAVKEWLDTAGDLVDDFRNTRALYPAERGVAFKGFISTALRRARGAGEKEQIEKMQSRLQESLTFTDDAEDATLSDATSFRGLSFDTWLYIFLQYAITLTRCERNHQDAYDVCSAAKEANVFYRSRPALFRIWTTWLACAIHVSDSESCSTIARWFMTTFQFQTEAYTLFVAALTMSRHGAETFHNNANQKYLLRQIKIMDESLTGKKRVNAASLTNVTDTMAEFVPTSIDVALLMLYGHILASGKSYISALNYYTRVYAASPENPMVLLSIGLAYLHRSMQRQSENRHIQALQAMTFIFDYAKQRTKPKSIQAAPAEPQETMDIDPPATVADKAAEEPAPQEQHPDDADLPERIQETKYNTARAFHQLGLTHLAVPYYEDALRLSKEATAAGRRLRGDVCWEAAYNLQMIYVTSGNFEVAAEVTKEWLVI